MIVVASLAVGFDLIRFFDLGFDRRFHSKIWTNPQFFFHSWMLDRLLDQLFQLAIITALISSLATLAFRLRRPKPIRRRLARQPGMAAILPVATAWMASAPWLIMWFFSSSEATAYAGFGMNLSIFVVLAGFGVAIKWSMLLLSRRWLAEPGWIDRLGRLVGVAWMVLSGCAIGLRMVC
jgi:hypothetical protein